MSTFETLALPNELLTSLNHMGFKDPTPIQGKAIPKALDGMDILGSAQTGTGKTGAFGIPLITKLLLCQDSRGIVITPTRELASQVATELKKMLGPKSKIKIAVLIGGDSMHKQLKQLQNNPRIVVGTPGRINDHLQRKKLKLCQTNYVVLDETDRMLDMGFSIQIDSILDHVKADRQTLLFSATLPRNIVNLAKRYMRDPIEISTSPTSSPAKNIKQETLKITEGEKYSKLVEQLDQRDGAIIVFVKTKHNADRMSDRLSKAGYETDTIHGDLRQSKRGRVINAFRQKKFRILVATDVAARGLDIPHIEHVINYDLPQCPEDYIHRIGRTARAGATGEAISFVTPSDGYLWKRIHRILNPDAKPQGEGNQRRSKGGFKGEKQFGYKGRRSDDSFGYKGRRSEEGSGYKGRRSDDSFGNNSRRSEEGSGYKGRRSDDSFGNNSRRSEEGSGYKGRRSDEQGKSPFAKKRRPAKKHGLDQNQAPKKRVVKHKSD